jgi:hypothetical protein
MWSLHHHLNSLISSPFNPPILSSIVHHLLSDASLPTYLGLVVPLGPNIALPVSSVRQHYLQHLSHLSR